MQNLDQARLNLLKLIADNGTDLANVSQAIGRNPAYLQQFIKRGSPRSLGEPEREALGRRFGVSPDLFRGDTILQAPSAVPDRCEASVRPPMSRNAQSIIPEYDIAAAAGCGAFPISDSAENGLDAVDQWSIPRRYLAAFTERPDSLAVIRVAGDSMEPDYTAGERVLVDRSHVLPSPPGVYVLWDGLGLVLKRVEVIFGTQDPVMIRISSINPAYSSYDRALSEVHINGRVVGKWQWK
ncbi:helix-turn-helix transcriptional regulator [Asaia lannensis]|uniref:S24 family peptidase n=1 Tax=Asaia lannensis TaxID=415421 RepID=UPI0038739DB7